MGSILGIKFREYGQIYYFEKSDFEVAIGDKVIVKTDQGQGLGTIVSIRDDVPEDAETEEIKPVHRLAVSEDFERDQENELLAREARQFCVDCIRSRDLEMKLVDVEVYFDRSKIVFYFTAPARIDFRELVKDLVKNYRTRIELRQIGVRHETQMIGAVGNCGMVCCCRQFLRTFAPVTIKMAKEQNLFLNPAKISGICGRLLCCLSYEQENYEEFYRACPKLGKKYQTADGSVKVLRANMFRNSIAVLTESNEEKEIPLEDWEQLKPSRPDQAKQDQARAAAKRAAREAERAAEEAAEGEGQDSSEKGAGDVVAAPGIAAAAADAASGPEAGSGSAAAAIPPVVPHETVAGPAEAGVQGSAEEGAAEPASSGEAAQTAQQAPAAEVPAQAASDNTAPQSAASEGKAPEKPAKDARLAPLRKPVKSADPAARKTSRGRRKRKRRPSSGGED
ncbi:hypothetical protein N1030_02295 [Desulfovibrio mangrovi]|uniref:PSP1 domain-containing protein n=1 Tax=Desulfovibrio mangrovi TaxID=2976983 RepID=UPI0022456E8E|nr:regulatory iron-sulfur-containing complex subunit RicT [Desulfovibrio mangrovi]UZP67824.1 hypothetical protein N1030_02295 [Desulfovibrio mangrovi]